MPSNWTVRQTERGYFVYNDLRQLMLHLPGTLTPLQVRDCAWNAYALCGGVSGWSVDHISATFDPITDDNAAGINPTTGNPAIAAGTWVTDLYSDRGGYLRNGAPTLGAWE